MYRINPFANDALDVVLMLVTALIIRGEVSLSQINKDIVPPDCPQPRNATKETCRPSVAAANRKAQTNERYWKKYVIT